MHELFQLFYKTSGVFTDSRNVRENGMFIALKGNNFNGNLFAEETIKAGAKYAIVDDPTYADDKSVYYVEDTLIFLQKLANYHRKKFDIPFIGITGSNGKTTTKELIYQVLSSHYSVLATQGNLNNHIGVPLTLLSVNTSHEIAIIEMGANKPHDIHELCEITEPTHGIITNIGAAHLEGFGSFEGVLHTKLELFESVQNSSGVIVVNADDDILISNSPTKLTKLFYSVKAKREVQGEIIQLNPYLNFVWWDDSETRHVLKTHLFGGYNLYNFLAAIRFGKLFNVPNNKINSSLESYVPSNNRSQITVTANNKVLVDCYNANPSSMQSAITSFIQMEAFNKVLILGDMLELGIVSNEKHTEILNYLNEENALYFTVGPLFYELKNNQAPQKFLNVNDCISYFEQSNLEDHFILLKGSRGIALEKLLPHL
jgi:UDP-N-acetylmuramoyl-tripeptide--D-alanyl-D-alanine ligase